MRVACVLCGDVPISRFFLRSSSACTSASVRGVRTPSWWTRCFSSASACSSRQRRSESAFLNRSCSARSLAIAASISSTVGSAPSIASPMRPCARKSSRASRCCRRILAWCAPGGSMSGFCALSSSLTSSPGRPENTIDSRGERGDDSAPPAAACSCEAVCGRPSE